MNDLDLPPILTSAQLADLLQTSVAALAQDRYLHRGVPFVKIGKRVRYSREVVVKYLADNRFGNSVGPDGVLQ